MSGQCYGCGTEFGVFKKEHGCKNCGFAFCSKCLHEKTVPVPKKNNAKHHVCQKCYKILTGAVPQSTEEAKYDLPEAYIKRLTALQEREKGAHSSQSAHTAVGGKVIPEHLRRLSPADREIAMRLEKLKADDRPKEKVTDADLQSRLAQLKGQHHVAEQKPMYKPPDSRTETQQVDDLIEQLIAEVDLDSKRPDPVREVEDRLARLRQADGSKSAIDNINLNQPDKGVHDVNDLNKIDKMGSIGRGYSKDGRNIQMEKGGASDIAEDEMGLEQIQQLMSQAAKEIELDAQKVMKGLQQDKVLMDKLKELQKQRADKTSADSDTVDSDADNTVQTVGAAGVAVEVSDDEDDEVSAKNIVQQCLDEAQIDAAVGQAGEPSELSRKQKRKGKKLRQQENSASALVELKPSNLQPPSREDLVDSDYDDTDELPYCCICTEDASIRCRDCDLDLYCQRCFKGCHDEMEITGHRTLPYTPPKGYR
ncbi:hypothetical protein BsWGS_09878 [Bradybaena similaris]